MMRSIYIETSIVGMLSMWPSNVQRVEERRLFTKLWFDRHQGLVSFVISDVVLAECQAGDQAAAAERLAVVQDIPAFELSDSALMLANQLVGKHGLPQKAKADAEHLAVCSVEGIDFLATWNCRHLANAMLRRSLEATILRAGYRPPGDCYARRTLAGGPMIITKDIKDFEAEGHPDPVLAWKDAVQEALLNKYGPDLKGMLADLRQRNPRPLKPESLPKAS